MPIDCNKAQPGSGSKSDMDRVILHYGTLFRQMERLHSRISEEGRSLLDACWWLYPDKDPVFQDEPKKAIAGRIRDHIQELNEAEGVRKDAFEMSSSLLAASIAGKIADAGLRSLNNFLAGNEVIPDEDVKLEKIFNTLNGHSDHGTLDHDSYDQIWDRMATWIEDSTLEFSNLNSFLGFLETTCSSIPFSVDEGDLRDISFFDQVKTSVAIAACAYDYLACKRADNSTRALLSKKSKDEMLAEDMFLLCSFDMSGIQDFIYNISGSGALKQLRSRSFYLEILLEHIVDELLVRLNLSRANLLYSGGGHAYLLLPNTSPCKAVLEAFENELNGWFIENFKTDLYLACAYQECSGEDLMNVGTSKDRYGNLYRELARGLSAKKANRYTAKTIAELNFSKRADSDHSRECTECRRSDQVIDADGLCVMCSSLRNISSDLVRKDVFIVERDNLSEASPDRTRKLTLPFGKILTVRSAQGSTNSEDAFVRKYTKNDFQSGDSSICLRMGDYEASSDGDRFHDYSLNGVTLDSEKGMPRLGVLRADIDDLGASFAFGFPPEVASLSRTAAFSRALNLFFKSRINEILDEGGYRVQVVYSGGDDLFIVGNWSDIIFAAIDIRNNFVEYMGNESLSLSAGIGIFPRKYPVARMAEETGLLEDAAKMNISKSGKPKDSVAIWSSENVFTWKELIDCVLPRMKQIEGMFAGNEKGKAFIYKLVKLMREHEQVSSAPRLAYLLTRAFAGQGEAGVRNSQMIYSWSSDDIERKYTIFAFEWFIYRTRERG